MGKLLNQYKKDFELAMKEQEKTSVTIEDEQEPLKPFKEALEGKFSFEVKFDTVTPQGTLVHETSSGVRVVLSFDVIDKDLPYYKDSNWAKFTKKPFVVKALEIDEENNTVYVRSAWNNSHTTRNRLIGEIMADLDKGKQVVLPGRIMESNDTRCLVDLLGAEILGIVNAKDWRKGYVRYLSKAAKVGQIYNFIVTRPLKERKNRTQAFKLIREPLTEDPWVALEEKNNKRKPDERLGVNSVIKVECIDKPVGKSFWWGVSPSVDDIEIMGDYGTAVKRTMKGVVYLCKIDKFDLKNHKLQVIPFDIDDDGKGTREAINWLQDKKVHK